MSNDNENKPLECSLVRVPVFDESINAEYAEKEDYYCGYCHSFVGTIPIREIMKSPNYTTRQKEQQIVSKRFHIQQNCPYCDCYFRVVRASPAIKTSESPAVSLKYFQSWKDSDEYWDWVHSDDYWDWMNNKPYRELDADTSIWHTD